MADFACLCAQVSGPDGQYAGGNNDFLGHEQLAGEIVARWKGRISGTDHRGLAEI